MKNENENINKGNKKIDRHISSIFWIFFFFYISSALILLYLFFKAIIDKKATKEDYILIVGLLATIIIIRFFIFGKKLKLVPSNTIIGGVRILRYEVNDNHVQAGNDIIPKGIEITNPNGIGIFNIHLELDNKLDNLKLTIYKMLETNIISDECRDIRDVVDFDIIARPEEKLNLKLDKSVFIKKLTVIEIYLP